MVTDDSSSPGGASAFGNDSGSAEGLSGCPLYSSGLLVLGSALCHQRSGHRFCSHARRDACLHICNTTPYQSEHIITLNINYSKHTVRSSTAYVTENTTFLSESCYQKSFRNKNLCYSVYLAIAGCCLTFLHDLLISCLTLTKPMNHE